MSLASDVTAAYRERQQVVLAGTYRDLLKLWPAFRPDDPDALAAWLAATRTLTIRDRRRFEALAREYAPLHAVASGVPDLTARPAAPMPVEQFDTSARVTSLVAYRKAIGAGKGREEALRIAYVRSAGALTRLALDGGRSSLLNTAATDTRVKGWRRVGNPKCQWCRELIARGTVYTSGDVAAFKSHDHCGCGAENVYTGEARESDGYVRSDRWSEANNARIRAYLRTL